MHLIDASPTPPEFGPDLAITTPALRRNFNVRFENTLQKLQPQLKLNWKLETAMKWILRTLLLLVAVVGVIALLGYFLPVAHEASRNAEFNQPPEAVFALIADPSSYSSWWSGADVKSEVVESNPPSRLVTKIVGETQFGGTWTIDVVPTPHGSRLTVTERGEIYNVVFRTLAKYVLGYTATMDSFLEAAQKKLST
jgi:hypothetical protein